MIRRLLKGAVGPEANDSRWLLDPHRRAVPGAATMRRYADDDEVDLCVVGAGPGGATLAQRLARRGWRSIAWSIDLMRRIWDAAGATETLTIARYAHLVGGCRMGFGPEDSVCDADQRTWAVPNLFIADGSVLPTQGAANPALTIMALSSRLADRMSAN